MKLPYQRYLELSHDDVHAEIRTFHAKQQYLLLHGLKHRGHLGVGFDSKKLFELVGKEIEFWPDLPGEIKLPIPMREQGALVREDSKLEFDDTETLEFDHIAQFLADALTRKKYASGEFPRRLYPSAGGLYPIEVFVCRLSENIPNWPVAHPVFHLKANSRELESMQVKATITDLKDSLSGFDASIGSPHFALVYGLLIDKAIFKYRYRGYRNSLMEAGSIYQLCDLYAKEFRLKNRVWAGFYDGLVAKKLNLDSTSILPCIVQFFGR